MCILRIDTALCNVYKAFYTLHRFYLICSFANHVHIYSHLQLFIMQKLKQRPKFYPGESEFCHFPFLTHTHTHTTGIIKLSCAHTTLTSCHVSVQSSRVTASLTRTSDSSLSHGEETLMSHRLEMLGWWVASGWKQNSKVTHHFTHCNATIK